MAKKRGANIPLEIKVDVGDQERPSGIAAYVFGPTGNLLASAPVEGDRAVVELPETLDGRQVTVLVAPSTETRGVTTMASLERMGAGRERVRVLAEGKPEIVVRIPPGLVDLLCRCRVRGRLVKRVFLPDGTVATQNVCDARVTICEVDRFPLFISKLPDYELFRLRDELLEKLREPIFPPPPPPPPESLGALRTASLPALQAEWANAGEHRTQMSATMQMQAAREKSFVAQDDVMRKLSAASSRVVLEKTVIGLADVIRPYLCDWPWLWSFYDLDCLTTVYVDSEGRFEADVWYPCGGDHPDIYFSVEQYQDGSWVSVYRPSVSCGTYWNYECGSETTINVPRAEGCHDPDYEVPAGVTLFVLPYAVGNTPIWGKPAGSPPAPFGWVQTDGLTDYTDPGLGQLFEAPFGGVLTFVQDDSYYVPTAGIKYYRYSYRRAGSSDEWTPIATPLARSYRMEYDDGSLPTYQSYPVGPHTIGGNSGLFEFKPQTPPELSSDPPTAVAREWTSGNLSEAAAVWDTNAVAPPLGPGQPVDEAGRFVIRVEVFDETGARVAPGPSTFRFLVQEESRTSTRLAESGSIWDPLEVFDDSFHFNVHVDNNRVEADLPQPSIGGVAASDECGFLRYHPHPSADTVLVQFRADHENDRAVFRFNVKRGSNIVPSAGAPAAAASPSYVEVAAAGANGYNLAGGYYEREFAPHELLGSCVDAAFAAWLGVYGKATNGTWRLGYDAGPWIAFALARHN